MGIGGEGGQGFMEGWFEHLRFAHEPVSPLETSPYVFFTAWDLAKFVLELHRAAAMQSRYRRFLGQHQHNSYAQAWGSMAAARGGLVQEALTGAGLFF